MIVGIGTDLCQAERMERAVERETFLQVSFPRQSRNCWPPVPENAGHRPLPPILRRKRLFSKPAAGDWAALHWQILRFCAKRAEHLISGFPAAPLPGWKKITWSRI